MLYYCRKEALMSVSCDEDGVDTVPSGGPGSEGTVFLSLPGDHPPVCPGKLKCISYASPTKQHSLAWPTFSVIQPTVGQNHLTQSLFYNRVLNISCNLLNTVLKVKTRKVCGPRAAVSVVQPRDPMAGSCAHCWWHHQSGKRQTQIQSMVSTGCMLLSHRYKLGAGCPCSLS